MANEGKPRCNLALKVPRGGRMGYVASVNWKHSLENISPIPRDLKHLPQIGFRCLSLSIL